MEPQQEPRKKRFRLVKLEERVVPAHLPAVAVVNVPDAPGIEVAQTHAHKTEFQVGTLPAHTYAGAGCTGGTASVGR